MRVGKFRCLSGIGFLEVKWMKGPRDILTRLQAGLDIPGQATGLEPITTLTGNREIAIDGQKGLLSFSETEIAVAVSGGAVAASGARLRIVLMKQSRIVIRGEIDSVRMERGTPV